MQQKFPTLEALLRHGFDALIDVRSPGEYSADHLPGALNLPVLSDAERAQVGTIYKQVSPFQARKIGAALVARNAAAHIQGPLAAHPAEWRPLVYCWRGGQRSGSFATILRQIGWRAQVIEGGYQSWRRAVQQRLYGAGALPGVVVLDGLTGTAKTALLPRLAARGVQVIDLEALANHRGSLLGARPEGQPSQKAFETSLVAAMAALDPVRPVVVEAESNKIGDLHLPPFLWGAMKQAPRVVVEAPLEARAAYLAQDYGDMAADPGALGARLAGLRALRGGAAYEGWMALLEAGDLTGLAQALMQQHYDPSYRKSSAAYERQILGQVALADLTPPAQEDAAARIAALLRAMPSPAPAQG